jgi:hypothetical protein
MRAFYVVAVLALAGCQTQPVVYDVPSNRSYDLGRADLFQNLVAASEAEGLSVVQADPSTGSLRATLVDYRDRGWAACKPARVRDRHDDKSRRGRGRPVDRQLDLVGNVDADSTVRLSTAYSERQINPFKNLPFRVRCPSTGELERRLFDRIGGG